MKFEDYEQLFAEARPQAPFANGDEGYTWVDANCADCWHDREQRLDRVSGPGCPLLLITLEGRTPVQWLDQKRLTPDGQMYELYSREGQYQCTEYRNEEDGPTEPVPDPDLPGQGELLPRSQFEAVRMLSPLSEPAVAAC